METEEFGILGLGDCEDSQSVMAGANCGDRNIQYRQNVNPKSELFLDISDRVGTITTLLEASMEMNAAVEAEEAENPENIEIATVPASKIPILEKMKRELMSIIHLSDKVDHCEVVRIHVVTCLLDIVNYICANWKTEKGEISFESEDVYAETLGQFLEMVSDKVQVLKLSSISTLSESINSYSGSGGSDMVSIYLTFTLTLLDFLGQPKKFKIPQQSLQIIHSTLRQVWIFLKSQKDFCSLILKNVINPEVFKLILTDDREYGIYCLMILLEMFHGSHYEQKFFETVKRWILEFKESKNVSTFLTIFIPFVKPGFLGDIVKSDRLISHLRTGLLSNSPTERKESLFVLKSLTSNQLLTETDTSLFKQNSAQVIKFWTDFFDLFEILDEKQVHIIKPVLPKLQTLRNVIAISNMSFDTLHWYFVLLKKMVGHDNRLVAREGLTNFFDAAEFIPHCTGHGHGEVRQLKNIFKMFLRDSLLPTLKESVGWILPEAKDFFEIAKRFGSALNQIYDKDFILIADRIMSFINAFDVGLSPHAIFFLILSMSQSLASPELLNFDPRILEILDKFAQFLLKGITALDKFLRLETQKLLVEIFCKIFKSGLEEVPNLSNQLSFRVLNFVGALDYFAVLFMGNLSETGIYTNVALNADHLNSTQILGLSRFSFLTGIRDPLHIQTKCEETQKNLFNARLDFMRIVSSLITPSILLISEMQEALHYWKSEQNFRTRYHPVFTPRFTFTFEQYQTILELIVEDACKADYQNELLGVMSNSSHVLAQQFRHLGENIQSDYEVLKFHIVFGKFLIFHVESSNVEYPATFFLENFPLVFDRTNISNSKYEETDDNFRAAFVEARLSALSMILQANEKRITNRSKETKDELKYKIIDLHMLKSVLDQIDLAGPRGIIPVLEFMGSSLSFIVDEDGDSIFELLKEFLATSWNSVFELRKTESFWVGVREFVKIIVHPYFTGRGIIDKYARKIFDESDTVTGISLVFVESISSAVKSGSVQSSISRRDEFIRVCEEAIWFGPPLLKHIKGTFVLWDYIQTQRSSPYNSVETMHIPTINDDSYNFVFTANVKTRLLGIKTIARIVDKDPTPDEVLEVFVGHFLDKNDFESDKKRRYFGNSCTHRIKHRISQALLVLQPMFSEALSKTVIFRLMSSLARDSPQPSVRYFMEWIIIRCLVKYPGTHANFFQLGEECYKKRVGFGSFLSTICLHASIGMKNQILLEFSEKSLRVLSTLLMGQHFTVRLYARVCFRRIYENVVSSIHPHPLILDKFEILYENVCADNQQPAGNVSKISQHIDSDFYVEVFNASEHYFFEVVFIYLPKIAGMASDELIQEKDLACTFSYDFILLFHSRHMDANRLRMDSDKKIRQLYIENEQFSWHLKAVSDDGREMGEETAGLVDDSPENNNFQKKLNPWKFLSVALEISDFSDKLQLRKSSCEDGLIVVASLVDRIPNLGGLCRTCEIFGVSKYVISRLKALDDKQFQNLSVSAQKWIEILEVPPNDLDTFLSSYSKKGYKILGVEQALESVPLNEYAFPKKSVLLLGNEKYGIPPHLLHLVNQCLEIPQVGVVRSLNVHVTGALCIWQYAMQHTVKT